MLQAHKEIARTFGLPHEKVKWPKLQEAAETFGLGTKARTLFAHDAESDATLALLISEELETRRLVATGA